MIQAISFHKDRVAINVLARDLDNARAAFEAAEGHAVIGMLSTWFDSVEQGAAAARLWQEQVCVSIGLGAGDPSQSRKAALIASLTAPAHLNQTFPEAGFAVGALAASGAKLTRVNAMVRPSGTPGQVILSTGAAGSAAALPALVDSDTAVLMVRDLGAGSIKFFPMGGRQSLGELQALAKSCVRHGLEMLEPTGGIDLANFTDILRVCLQAGVAKVIPHVYSSIVDRETGNTRPGDVAELVRMMKQLVSTL